MIEWTDEQSIASRAQGWNAGHGTHGYTIYNATIKIYDTDNIKFFNSEQARAFVIEQAAAGDLLAQQAIEYITFKRLTGAHL